ncbi:MAG TPA: tetratricopeptide repeat-containing sensor histidine kinase [Cyclobacteriaceae bacterium]|nr:tetratricopeptide repeat-containing sensor histidine kinase [Cyclobacteriaceae bacterium]
MILTLLLCRSFFAHSQTVSGFKELLGTAKTAEEFSQRFTEMITTFHDGKLDFQDGDVGEIVGLAQSKEFSDVILPAVYGWAGSMYGNGRMREAIAYFMESASLYGKRGKHKAESLCYFQIALIQHKAENFAEASEFYTKALQGSDSLDHRTAINCYNGLALIKREAGNFDVAEKDFRNAYNIAVSTKDTAWIAILVGNIGSIHAREGHYDSALYYYKRNLNLVRKTTEFENEIETYIHLARIYLDKNSLNNAFAYLDTAVNFINKRKISFNDYFNPMDDVNRLYALAWAHRGDYKKAFDYYSRFHEVAEEKQDRLNGRSLKQLQLSYNFEQKQHELDLLKQINQANMATIKQQQYLEIASVFIIGLLSVLAIVTYQTSRQRKKMNRTLEQTNIELERLNKLKNKLFSVISHDLRTPLGNLQSILGLYQTGDLDANSVASVAGKLGQQVKASGHVLENLLEWAKSELHESKNTPANIVLREKVEKVLLQFDTDLRSKNIIAKNEVPEEIRIWADRAQMQIILRNLLVNSIKFTGENGVISIAATSDDTNVRITVKDNGVGMTPEQLSKLFHSDQLVTTLGTNKEKGSGIGLLITKELVMNNGGTIEAQSSKGMGATFIITLPKP